MSFEEWIKPYFARRRMRDASASFESFKRACALFDNPQNAFEAVHIAGTNGKGSVAWGASKQLEKNKLRVGLFTSPHLVDFCERIRINSALIPKGDVMRLGPEIISRVQEHGIDLHFFEWATLLSLIYFREQGVDIAVYETGIGGLWDPTSVVQTKVAAITSIGRDHEALLGDTLPEIARHKAAILKEGAVAILSASSALWISKPGAICIEGGGSVFDENARMVRAIVEALGLQVRGSIERPPCRFEEIAKDIIIDVAHNPEGFCRLNEMLEGSDWKILVALCKDKDPVDCLKPLKEKADSFHITAFEGDRAMSLDRLARAASPVHVVNYESLDAAVLGWLRAGGRRLICGSFYLIAPALKILDQQGLRSAILAQ